LVRPATLTLAVGLLGLALLLAGQYNRTALGVGVSTAVALLPFVQIAHERTEPLFSWRPFARLIREAAPDESRVFFRAEDEYQLCGGLNYYLEQRIDLLAPPSWVPPTFSLVAPIVCSRHAGSSSGSGTTMQFSSSQTVLIGRVTRHSLYRLHTSLSHGRASACSSGRPALGIRFLPNVRVPPLCFALSLP